MRITANMTRQMQQYVDKLIVDPNGKLLSMDKINSIDCIKKAQEFFYSYFTIKTISDNKFHEIGGVSNVKEFVEYMILFIDYELPKSYLYVINNARCGITRDSLYSLIDRKGIRRFSDVRGYKYRYKHIFPEPKVFIPATKEQLDTIRKLKGSIYHSEEMTVGEAKYIITNSIRKKPGTKDGCFAYF